MSAPSPLFRTLSSVAVAIGLGGFAVGLYNAELKLSEKGYYFMCILFAMYVTVSLQKAVRDKEEGLPVSSAYMVASVIALIISLGGIPLGLMNTESIALNEKGYFFMSSILSLFGAVVVQKNARDTAVEHS